MTEIRDLICTWELLKDYRKKLALFFFVKLKNTKETLKVRFKLISLERFIQQAKL